MGKKRVFT